MGQVGQRPQPTLLWLRAETFIHVSAGQQASLIDLPFVREGASGFPYIPGSGMKGALRDAARVASGWSGGGDPQSVTDLFGFEDNAGRMLVSDARLAFLPVRSLSLSYRYLTSSELLHRLARDMTFCAQPQQPIEWAGDAAVLGQNDGKALFEGKAGEPVFLEEFAFQREGDPALDDQLLRWLPNVVVDIVRRRAVVLSSEDFDYFARHGLHVRTRNKLDPKTKTVERTALWTEESLPPDTLMYVALIPRLAKYATCVIDFCTALNDKANGYFQVGGNETVGEGWFQALNLLPRAACTGSASQLVEQSI